MSKKCPNYMKPYVDDNPPTDGEVLSTLAYVKQQADAKQPVDGPYQPYDALVIDQMQMTLNANRQAVLTSPRGIPANVPPVSLKKMLKVLTYLKRRYVGVRDPKVIYPVTAQHPLIISTFRFAGNEYSKIERLKADAARMAESKTA